MTSYASAHAGKLVALRKKNIERTTLTAGLFCGLLTGIFFNYNYWVPCLLFFVMVYLVENLRKPILTGFLADNVPNEILASVISTQSFYKTFITATLSLIIGVMADLKGIGISLAVVSIFLISLTFLIEYVSNPKKHLKNLTL